MGPSGQSDGHGALDRQDRFSDFDGLLLGEVLRVSKSLEEILSGKPLCHQARLGVDHEVRRRVPSERKVIVDQQYG